MEVQTRRHRTVQIQEQEYVYAVKGKGNIALPAKEQGLGTRGALGDINTNVQIQRDVNVGKVACATAEFEKKATINRGAIKCNYSYVQSKINTGLAAKNAPIQASSRPPLRHEESTTGLANRPVARTRAALKEKPAETKDSINFYIQTKKTESRKITKLPGIKEQKEYHTLKSMLKKPKESLGKLKLAEEKSSLIDHVKLPKHAARLHEILDTTPELPDDIEDIDTEEILDTTPELPDDIEDIDTEEILDTTPELPDDIKDIDTEDNPSHAILYYIMLCYIIYIAYVNL